MVPRALDFSYFAIFSPEPVTVSHQDTHAMWQEFGLQVMRDSHRTVRTALVAAPPTALVKCIPMFLLPATTKIILSTQTPHTVSTVCDCMAEQVPVKNPQKTEKDSGPVCRQ